MTVAGKEYAKCKLCDNQQLPKACRLKLHYVKCSAAHHLPAEKEIPEQPMSVKRPRSPSPPPTKRQAISIQPDMDSCVVKTCMNTVRGCVFIVLNYIIVADSDAIKNNTPLFPVSS